MVQRGLVALTALSIASLVQGAVYWRDKRPTLQNAWKGDTPIDGVFLYVAPGRELELSLSAISTEVPGRTSVSLNRGVMPAGATLAQPEGGSNPAIATFRWVGPC